MAITTGHVGINVTDLARSERFYSDLFGLTRVGGSDDVGHRFAFLGDGERIVLTLWEQGRGTFDGNAPGLHHLSFQFATMDGVRDAERRLREVGVKFVYDGVVAHREGSASGGIFFEDPDGTRLEIYAPSGAELQHAPVAGAPSCGFF